MKRTEIEAALQAVMYSVEYSIVEDTKEAIRQEAARVLGLTPTEASREIEDKTTLTPSEAWTAINNEYDGEFDSCRRVYSSALNIAKKARLTVLLVRQCCEAEDYILYGDDDEDDDEDGSEFTLEESAELIYEEQRECAAEGRDWFDYDPDKDCDYDV
jgi:hypothetical protein